VIADAGSVDEDQGGGGRRERVEYMHPGSRGLRGFDLGEQPAGGQQVGDSERLPRHHPGARDLLIQLPHGLPAALVVFPDVRDLRGGKVRAT
jgi:hypothetical protein